jgi:hypothetical protein
VILVVPTITVPPLLSAPFGIGRTESPVLFNSLFVLFI